MAEKEVGVNTFIDIAVLFGSLSLMSIGGGNAVLPDMHREAVGQHHWMTSAQFADMFSISQTTPGPSILIVAMIGYGAGLSAGGVLYGIIGGVLAAICMVLPAASLVYTITLFWQKAQESKLRKAVEKGFAPITVGLILATSLVMSRAADHDWRAYALTGLCTLVFVRSSLNPLFLVGLAAFLGYLGVV